MRRIRRSEVSAIDHILITITIIAAFVGGISSGIFLVCVCPKLRKDVNEIAERDELNKRKRQ